MKVTEDDIKLIIQLISEKLGPNVSTEKVRSIAEEAINQLSIVTVDKALVMENVSESIEALKETKGSRKLIVNAFGLAQSGLEESLRAFLTSKNLPITALSSTTIEQYKSVIAIIDYSDYESDINPLKFELSELCGKFGFKTIVQDSAYYGIL